MNPSEFGYWIAFNGVVLLLLALDLFVFQRKPHKVALREAALWSGFWVALSLAFNVLIYFWKGREPALQFLTGYAIEKALSLDNIFVFLVIFEYFAIPQKYQHRVLFWGVLGALVMRGVMIYLGSTLILHFDWVLYVFGAFLLFTGVRMLRRGEIVETPEQNWAIRLARKWTRVTRDYHEGMFIVSENGKRAITPMALALIAVESTDLVFALDSIPAIFGVTQDFFIVYTSNVCAILGLRALYFVLAGLVRMLAYLKTSLALVLSFIGIKMLIEPWIEIPIEASLGVVTVLLGGGVIASLMKTKS
jgi:tellurite resistance protein TerC